MVVVTTAAVTYLNALCLYIELACQVPTLKKCDIGYLVHLHCLPSAMLPSPEMLGWLKSLMITRPCVWEASGTITVFLNCSIRWPVADIHNSDLSLDFHVSFKPTRAQELIAYSATERALLIQDPTLCKVLLSFPHFLRVCVYPLEPSIKVNCPTTVLWLYIHFQFFHCASQGAHFCIQALQMASCCFVRGRERNIDCLVPMTSPLGLFSHLPLGFGVFLRQILFTRSAELLPCSARQVLCLPSCPHSSRGPCD